MTNRPCHYQSMASHPRHEAMTSHPALHEARTRHHEGCICGCPTECDVVRPCVTHVNEPIINKSTDVQPVDIVQPVKDIVQPVVEERIKPVHSECVKQPIVNSVQEPCREIDECGLAGLAGLAGLSGSTNTTNKTTNTANTANTSTNKTGSVVKRDGGDGGDCGSFPGGFGGGSGGGNMGNTDQIASGDGANSNVGNNNMPNGGNETNQIASGRGTNENAQGNNNAGMQNAGMRNFAPQHNENNFMPDAHCGTQGATQGLAAHPQLAREDNPQGLLLANLGQNANKGAGNHHHNNHHHHDSSMMNCCGGGGCGGCCGGSGGERGGSSEGGHHSSSGNPNENINININEKRNGCSSTVRPVQCIREVRPVTPCTPVEVIEEVRPFCSNPCPIPCGQCC
ncbi:hypothetical protein FN846DRAFT_976788 [Sphaerosporella brunnea]|uniref:Uncharacterized protein n=1 Tax=Sphaerosporella brunnea TaxID=1250544 RepID=A0A5J5EEZ9_9PEZI|nr:hypothetical protein FN846DRAFT_976788 [Sphaerosporella brunnea]